MITYDMAAHWQWAYNAQLEETSISKLGWPHQRENAVSDGVVSHDLDFEGLPMRIWSCNFGTNKLEWMRYIAAEFRDSISMISWFAHRCFLPPDRPPARR